MPPHLDLMCAHLDGNGVRFQRGSRALADERLVADLVMLDDPVGNRIEFFHTPEVTPEPFVPVAQHLRLPHRPARRRPRRDDGRRASRR